MLAAGTVGTLAQTFSKALQGDMEWLRRVFIIGSLSDDHEDFVAHLALTAQAKLARDITFYGSDTPFPSSKIVLIDDFDTVLDIQLVQRLASNGNVVLCKFKAGNVVTVLRGVSGPDFSAASNQPSLLNYLRFVATYSRADETQEAAGNFYSSYLLFDRVLQGRIKVAQRHSWRDVVRPHLSIEARSPNGKVIFTRSMGHTSSALDAFNFEGDFLDS